MKYLRDFIIGSSILVLFPFYYGTYYNTYRKYSYYNYTLAAPLWFGLWNIISLIIAEKCISCFEKGGKLLLAGNGGSAAMASHVCVDFTKVAKVRAINFNEADLITCFSNDYGYEKWLEKAIQYYCEKEKIIIQMYNRERVEIIFNKKVFEIYIAKYRIFLLIFFIKYI